MTERSISTKYRRTIAHALSISWKETCYWPLPSVTSHTRVVDVQTPTHRSVDNARLSRKWIACMSSHFLWFMNGSSWNAILNSIYSHFKARKSVYLFLNLQRITFPASLPPIVHILYFFLPTWKCSKRLNLFPDVFIINAFFGTNPLITDANVALDAYIAACYETRRTALSASLHTTSGRMRSFLHWGPHHERMKRFFCHRRTPYAINIMRYI